jgi:hypothetical protein
MDHFACRVQSRLNLLIHHWATRLSTKLGHAAYQTSACRRSLLSDGKWHLQIVHPWAYDDTKDAHLITMTPGPEGQPQTVTSLAVDVYVDDQVGTSCLASS